MDDALEVTLLQKPEAVVYKIPPRPSTGHRAEDWKDAIWKGKALIVAQGEKLAVKLVDKQTGALFAACPVPEKIEQAVERTVDSSRYFVLRVADGKGRHAFLGLGFEERNDAFDFNAALNDFQRRKDQEKAGADASSKGPQRDLRLQEGQKLKVAIPGVATRKQKPAAPAQSAGSGGGLGGFALLPPPPAPAAGIRRAKSPSAPKGDGGATTSPPKKNRSPAKSPKKERPPQMMMSPSGNDEDPFATAPPPPMPKAVAPSPPPAPPVPQKQASVPGFSDPAQPPAPQPQQHAAFPQQHDSHGTSSSSLFDSASFPEAPEQSPPHFHPQVPVQQTLPSVPPTNTPPTQTAACNPPDAEDSSPDLLDAEFEEDDSHTQGVAGLSLNG